jgi:hypothetical protein
MTVDKLANGIFCMIAIPFVWLQNMNGAEHSPSTKYGKLVMPPALGLMRAQSSGRLPHAVATSRKMATWDVGQLALTR